jgi:mannose-6-phosphate isomerase-like protein (cupin superfamily)
MPSKSTTKKRLGKRSTAMPGLRPGRSPRHPAAAVGPCNGSNGCLPMNRGIRLITGGTFMRAQFLAFTFLATAAASSALAQQTAPPAKTFMNNKEIMGLIDKAKADRKGDAPLVAEPILSLAPYRAQLEYRPGTSPAAVHEKDAELMVVLEGTGDIVTGGKLADEKRTNANNLSGASITGGNSQAVVKGDMLIVPANTPHQVIPTGGAPIVLMTLHVPHPPTNWPPAN